MNSNFSNNESAGVLAPAPVFYVIASGVGAVVEWLRPSVLLAQAYSVAVGAALILVSIALVVSVLVQMSRAGTSFDARKATSALITSGVFQLSRNPTYVALTLLQAGLAFAFQSFWVLLLVVPAAAITHWGVVLREERYLQGKFGAEYLEYARRVRRWL